MTTDHTREALAETILSARWPDGGLIEHLTRKTTTFVADAILGSDWLAAHDAALVEGRDAENTRLRAERDALAQAIHDARGILGFDNDGDTTPHTTDYVQYAEFHRRDATEQRKDYDDLSAENENLTRDLAEARAALAAERERIGAAIEADKSEPDCAPAFIRRTRAALIARSSTDCGDTHG